MDIFRTTSLAQGGRPEAMLMAVGEMSYLAAHDPIRQNWNQASALMWHFQPAMAGTLEIFRSAGKPVGYLTWARLTKEDEEAYVATGRIEAGRWLSGDRLWVVDMVAPFDGFGKRILKYMRQDRFCNDVGRTMRTRVGSGQRRVFYWQGEGAVEAARDRARYPSVDMNAVKALIEKQKKQPSAG